MTRRLLIAIVAALAAVALVTGLGRLVGGGGGDEPAVTPTARYPVWSPDGRWIAFVRSTPRPAGATDLYVVGAEGRRVERRVSHVSRAVAWRVERAAWSPNGRRIAFVALPARDPRPRARVVVTDLAGLVLWSGGPFSGPVVWSADGTALAFDPGQGVRFYAPDGRRLAATRVRCSPFGWVSTSRRVPCLQAQGIAGVARRLRALREVEPAIEAGALSPDGRSIAVPEIDRAVMAVVEISSLRKTHLPTSSGDSTLVGLPRDPAWSPNGRLLAFVSRRVSTRECWVMICLDKKVEHPESVWVVNRDGTGLRIVTRPAPDAGGDFDPRWSADGRWLLVDRVAADGGVSTVAVSTTGRGERAVERDASWSPEGARLVFSRPWPGSGGDAFGTPAALYTRDVSSAHEVRLTQLVSTP